MAKPKFDGVVDAVHYSPEGQVAWVRAYQRRGPTFSDLTLVSRQELVERLKKGDRWVTGSRKPYLASTFEVFSPLRLVQVDGKEFLTLTENQPGRDCLDGLPIV